LPICKFTTTYADYEIGKTFRFYFACQEEDPLASGFCIFHDKDYLQDKTNYEEHKKNVLDRFKHKVNDAISNKKPLFCIGFQLPDFNLSDLSIGKEFTKPVYFNGSEFFGEAYFYDANFQGKASFSDVKFQEGASFSDVKFQGEASSLELISKNEQPSPELISKEVRYTQKFVLYRLQSEEKSYAV